MNQDVKKLLNPIQQHCTSHVLPFPPQMPPTALRWAEETDRDVMPPMLFRTEAFAEDLLDLYPSY